MPRVDVTAITLPIITPEGAEFRFGSAEAWLLVWANEVHGWTNVTSDSEAAAMASLPM
jgi:hypothetical protein